MDAKPSLRFSILALLSFPNSVIFPLPLDVSISAFILILRPALISTLESVSIFSFMVISLSAWRIISPDKSSIFSAEIVTSAFSS